jgi:hypothetical protein
LGLSCDLLVRGFQLNIFLTVLVSGILCTWPHIRFTVSLFGDVMLCTFVHRCLCLKGTCLPFSVQNNGESRLPPECWRVPTRLYILTSWKGKPIPLQALRVLEGWGSQISKQSAHEGGKVVSIGHPPPLPPRNIPGP